MKDKIGGFVQKRTMRTEAVDVVAGKIGPLWPERGR
jgi:hypothetical protein